MLINGTGILWTRLTTTKITATSWKILHGNIKHNVKSGPLQQIETQGYGFTYYVPQHQWSNPGYKAKVPLLGGYLPFVLIMQKSN